MYCQTCGQPLEIREIMDGNVVYRCTEGHWWVLDRQTGFRPMAAPQDPPDPTAAGAEDTVAQPA